MGEKSWEKPGVLSVHFGMLIGTHLTICPLSFFWTWQHLPIPCYPPLLKHLANSCQCVLQALGTFLCLHTQYCDYTPCLHAWHFGHLDPRDQTLVPRLERQDPLLTELSSPSPSSTLTPSSHLLSMVRHSFSRRLLQPPDCSSPAQESDFYSRSREQTVSPVDSPSKDHHGGQRRHW